MPSGERLVFCASQDYFADLAMRAGYLAVRELEARKGRRH
jgi:hypothetical protein